MKNMKKYAVIIMTVLLCMSISVTAFAKGMDNFKPALQYTGFLDVAEGAWYHGVVKTAFEYGLVKGASAAYFEPDGTLTVAEAIVMADRIHSIYEKGGHELTNGTPWYQTYVDYAIDNEIISEGDFDDYERNITRGEMAYLFTRALPQKEYKAINEVPENKPSDIEGYRYEESIRMLFESGIVMGNDPYGTYTPDENIKRSEAAAVISRIADKSLRAKVALFDDFEFDRNITVAAHYDSLSSYFELDESNVELAFQVTPGNTSENGTVIVYKWKEYTPVTLEEYRNNIAKDIDADPSAVRAEEVSFGDAKAYRHDAKVKVNGAYIRLAGYTVNLGSEYYEIHETVVYSGNDEDNAKADRLLCDMINNVKVNGAAPSSRLAN